MHIQELHPEHLPGIVWPEPHVVHLWHLPLDAHIDPSSFYALLNREEQLRAERFRMESVRRQFVAARGWLRTLLGKYLGMEGPTVPIHYHTNGKPYVISPLQSTTLEFNLSHSGRLALLAVTTNCRVGVDVEEVRAMPDVEGLVARFFAPREQMFFQQLPQHERLSAFFRAWTRKEAALKAIGQGIASVDQCVVTFGADETPEILSLGDEPQVHQRWRMHSWQPREGYEAAVAIEIIAREG